MRSTPNGRSLQESQRASFTQALNRAEGPSPAGKHKTAHTIAHYQEAILCLLSCREGWTTLSFSYAKNYHYYYYYNYYSLTHTSCLKWSSL